MSIRLLFIVDVPGWAHDKKTDGLRQALDGAYDIQKRYHADVSEGDLDGADVVLIYYWYQLESLRHLEPALVRNRLKLLIGVCSHGEVDGEGRATGLATLHRWAQGVFALNQRLAETCERHLDLPVFYTPNGVDTCFYTPDVLRRRGRVFRVGWAGSLENHGRDLRGVDLIRSVAAELPGIELVMAAREERWRGRDEMLAFYRSLDVYICASREEGVPNPCLEAAACGVPLVTTAVGCLPELVRDGANSLFIQRDPEDMKAKLRRLRDDEGLRRELGLALRQDIESWDWAILAGRYFDMIEAFVSRVPGKFKSRTSLESLPAASSESQPAGADRRDGRRQPETSAARGVQHRTTLAAELRASRKRVATLTRELDVTHAEVAEWVADLQEQLVRANRPFWRRLVKPGA